MTAVNSSSSRSRSSEISIKVGREDGEVAGVAGVAGESSIDAAIVVVADAIESGGISDGQGAKQKNMDERKDGGVCTDAEGEGGDRGGRETRGLAQLAKRVANVLKELIHGVCSPFCFVIRSCGIPVPDGECYSVLSACMGLTEAARCAGMKQAASATRQSTTATVRNVNQSVEPTPNRRPRRNRVR